jgi:hypothetical protein
VPSSWAPRCSAEFAELRCHNKENRRSKGSSNSLLAGSTTAGCQRWPGPRPGRPPAPIHLSATLRSEFGPRDVRVTGIEPGLAGGQVDNAEPSTRLDGMFRTFEAMTSEDIADLIAYVTGRPARVNLRRVIVMPTRRAWDMGEWRSWILIWRRCGPSA